MVPAHASPEYLLIEALARATRGVLLLTATPEQLGKTSHFARLRLLDPDRFPDYDAFVAETHGYEPVALKAFPGMKEMGLLESNGHQNYVNWEDLVSYCPYPEGSWIRSRDGLFHLDKDFYEKSGGILKSSNHYINLF